MMPGTPLAEAFVRVRALTDKFKDDVQKGFEGVGDDFGKQFAREASARLRAENATFGQAGRTAGDAFGQQMAETGAVRFGADGAPFVEVGRETGDEAGAAAGEAFGRRFAQDARGRWHDERGRFVSESEATGEESGRGFNRGFGRGIKQSTGDADGFGSSMRRIGELGKSALDGMLPSLGKLAAGLGSTLTVTGGVAAGVATLGAAAASSAGFVTVLAAELAPLSGLLAALPGVALVGAAAFSTWKLATGGLGEAMGAALSGNLEALAAAMGKLSERGRDFIREFDQAIPVMHEFKAAAQDSFLEPIIGQLGRWLDAASALKPAISDLAGVFGQMVRTALDFATSERTLLQFNAVFENTRLLVGAVKDALQPLLRGFVDLGTIGSFWLADMAGSLKENLTTFGEWMSRIAQSGQAWQWMDAGLVVLKALGTLAKDLIGIVNGLFGAARDAGAGALGVISQLVSQFNQWVNSAKGQEVLVTVFKALDQVGRALTPVIVALGGAVAAIAPEAAKVATALGPVLAEAITVLGKGVAAMGPGLVRMVESFGDMVTAIGPLEPLGRALGGVFAAIGGAAALIVPELAKIAVELAPALTNAIKALAPALVQLSPGLQEIAKHLAKAFADPALADGLLKLGKGISDVLIAAAPLLPVIAQLAGILGQVLGGALTNLGVALGPIITALASALEPALGAISRALAVLIPYMEPIYKAFGDIGAALITQLLPPLLNLVPVIIDSLIPAFADFLTQLQPLIPLLADLAVKLIQQVLPAILPILPQLADLSVQIAAVGLVLAKLVADVGPFIDRIIGFFQRLYDTLVGHSIIPDLINGIRDWFQKGIDWVLGIVDGFGKIPERIGQWLGQAVSQVQNKWSEIRSTIDGKINEIQSRISNGLDTIRGQWNSVWEGVRNFVGDQFNQIRNAVNGGIDGVVGYFRDLPNRVRGAVGDLGGVLYDSGRSLMQGLINGIYSMWQTAYNAATDVLNHLRSLFPFSPAKDGPFSGKGWTLYSGRSMMTGLASGIASQQAAVTGALDSVLSAGAATLGAGLQVPLSGMAGATAAPDFAGVLGAPSGAAAVVGPTRGVSVQGDLHVHVQGVFDPSNPVGYRRMIEGVRAAIIDLEREEYASG